MPESIIHKAVQREQTLGKSPLAVNWGQTVRDLRTVLCKLRFFTDHVVFQLWGQGKDNGQGRRPESERQGMTTDRWLVMCYVGPFMSCCSV